MELWRRALLLACLCGALILALRASLDPLVTVIPVDCAKEQKEEGSHFDSPFKTERQQYLSQLPLDEYIQETTKGILVIVEGPEWEEFFDSVTAASFQATATDKEWARRMDVDEKQWNMTPKRFFFRPDEGVLKNVAGRFRTDNQDLVLALSKDGQTRYLRETYHVFSDDDFGFGTGFRHHPKPASYFLFPQRRLSPWLALLGVALYIVLPWRKKAPGIIAYARWRIVLGDIVSLVLILLFFILPFFIIGGFVQGFTKAWGLFFVLWPLSLLGGWLYKEMAVYASFCAEVLSDRLKITTLKGAREIPFAEIKAIRHAAMLPPRWFTALLWVGALASRGASRAGAAGRALIVGGSRYEGLALLLRDGSTIYIWTTDQMGNNALLGSEKIEEAVKAAGVEAIPEPKVIRSLGLVTLEERLGGKAKAWTGFALGLLMALPIAVALGYAVYALFFWSPTLPHAPSTGIETREPAETTKAATPEAIRPLADEDLEWEKYFSGPTPDAPSGGSLVELTADGGYLVVGYSHISGNNVDIVFVKTDAQGNRLWQKTFGTELQDYPVSLLHAKEGGYILAAETRPHNMMLGNSAVYVLAVDETANKKWDKTLGREGTDLVPCSAIEDANSRYRIYARSGTGISLLTLDGSGNKLDETIIQEAESTHQKETRWIEPTADGGFIAAGEILNPGIGFKDIFLQKFNSEFKEEWQKTFGGKQKESPSYIRQTRDSGYIVTGVTASFGSGGEDLYLVRTDASGNGLWEKAYGTPGDDAGAWVIETPDGGFAAVGESKGSSSASPAVFLLKTDGEGNRKWEKSIAGEGGSYSGSFIRQTADGGFILTGTRTKGEFFKSDIVLLKTRPLP
jgi:hypothetical protein